MNQQTLKDQINGTSKESTDPQDQIIRTLNKSTNPQGMITETLDELNILIRTHKPLNVQKLYTCAQAA